MNASVAASAPPTDSQGAFAPGAGNTGPHPGAGTVSPAARGRAIPNASATPEPRPGARTTVDAIPRAAAEWPGRGGGSKGSSARKPGYASVAASLLRRRAASSARPAGRRGALKSEISTPPGERKGFAAGAEDRSSRELPGAARAPRSRRRAHPERTPSAGSAITTGAHGGFASTAASMRTQG